MPSGEPAGKKTPTRSPGALSHCIPSQKKSTVRSRSPRVKKRRFGRSVVPDERSDTMRAMEAAETQERRFQLLDCEERRAAEPVKAAQRSKRGERLPVVRAA